MHRSALRYLMITLIVGSYINCLYEHTSEIRAALAGVMVHAPKNQCGHDESGCFCRGAVVISAVQAESPELIRFVPSDELLAFNTVATLLYSGLSSSTDGLAADFDSATARSGRVLRTRLVSLLN